MGKNGLVFELREHPLPPFVLYVSRRRRVAHLSLQERRKTDENALLRQFRQIAILPVSILEFGLCYAQVHPSPYTNPILTGHLWLMREARINEFIW